ncbi:YjbH domain-containing protein [Rhodosalinus halophilus]|uniref:YjbH domain-containing protein n=1 Tax=Rhodosalinus halophilus TaxID=2259333 RepID=UPI001F49117D|nr:YjbH domain-containing protein [Rhodosalinus halophilus]
MALLCAAPGPAQELPPEAGFNTYGTPGLIDMPTARSRRDGELAFTLSHFRNQTRSTLTFQVTPRLSASFRYANLYDIRPGGPDGAVVDFRFDRSFSLQYRLFEETATRPAVAVGLNDFLGTGLYSSEYVVASKTFSDRLRVTGGLGWGRLGTEGGFTNPLGILGDRFEDRPERDSGLGGEVRTAQWFRGDAALFGGLEWQATDRLTLLAEYSSDAYPNEDGAAFDRRSPLNFGAQYDLRPGITLGLNYLYGAEFGAQVTFATDPATRPFGSGRGAAPPPVVPRGPASAADLGWDLGAAAPGLRDRAAAALAAEGVRLHAFDLRRTHLRIEIENLRYRATAQAVGRTARALTGLLPASVETLTVVPVFDGVAGSAITIRRSDLEELEFAYDNVWASFARARIEGARPAESPVPGRYPRFETRIEPYISPSLFDPDAPIRADAGIALGAEWEPAPGWLIAGRVQKKVIGNLDESDRPSTSVLPRVRSEFNIYDREGDPALTELSANYFFQPRENLYGRLSFGYLERMFGGVSGELLWKEVESPLALGLEVNYVKQRDFDQGFGFRDYEVATGHASLYWDMGNGFHTQVDAGRYLAGDWGATLTVDREFANGWRVGAFATLTDVPFDDFGEGSFDKGLRLTIPLDWITGQEDRRSVSTVIRPVQRDGGQRLDVDHRLYEKIREAHRTGLREDWGRFWR